jgi:hypothetical protein
MFVGLLLREPGIEEELRLSSVSKSGERKLKKRKFMQSQTDYPAAVTADPKTKKTGDHETILDEEAEPSCPIGTKHCRDTMN